MVTSVAGDFITDPDAEIAIRFVRFPLEFQRKMKLTRECFFIRMKRSLENRIIRELILYYSIIIFFIYVLLFYYYYICSILLLYFTFIITLFFILCLYFIFVTVVLYILYFIVFGIV